MQALYAPLFRGRVAGVVRGNQPASVPQTRREVSAISGFNLMRRPCHSNSKAMVMALASTRPPSLGGARCYGDNGRLHGEKVRAAIAGQLLRRKGSAWESA